MPKRKANGCSDLREGVRTLEILKEERAKEITCWLKVIKLRNHEAQGWMDKLVKFLGD